MLFGWVIVLGLCALIAGVLGFLVLAGIFAFFAQILFLFFLAFMVMTLVSRWMAYAAKAEP